MDSRALALCVVLAACGGDAQPAVGVDASEPDAPIDAYVRGPCWPMDTSVPGGSVELGTGYPTYRAMPDVLPLIYGQQGGYHIEARARTRNMTIGDPIDILNPKNPRTRFQAYFVDTGLPINGPLLCPTRQGYVPADDGDGFVLALWFEIRFDTAAKTEDIFDKQYRVVVEVIDSDGKYATEEKIITAIAPSS